eukprot:265427-Chlamydomonas_euryale.AAC.3
MVQTRLGICTPDCGVHTELTGSQTQLGGALDCGAHPTGGGMHARLSGADPTGGKSGAGRSGWVLNVRSNRPNRRLASCLAGPDIGSCGGQLWRAAVEAVEGS